MPLKKRQLHAGASIAGTIQIIDNRSIAHFSAERKKFVMNISEEIRISTYQLVVFVADTELAKLYEAMNDYWKLDKESGRTFAASVFYNLGRVHGKREERARRKRGATT